MQHSGPFQWHCKSATAPLNKSKKVNKAEHLMYFKTLLWATVFTT